MSTSVKNAGGGSQGLIELEYYEVSWSGGGPSGGAWSTFTAYYYPNGEKSNTGFGAKSGLSNDGKAICNAPVLQADGHYKITISAGAGSGAWQSWTVDYYPDDNTKNASFIGVQYTNSGKVRINSIHHKYTVVYHTTLSDPSGAIG